MATSSSSSSSFSKLVLLSSSAAACVSITALYLKMKNNNKNNNNNHRFNYNNESSEGKIKRLLKYMSAIELAQTGVGIVCAAMYSWTTLELTSDIEKALDPRVLHGIIENLGPITSKFLRRAFISEVYNFLYLLAVKCAGQRLAYRLRRDAFRALLTQPTSYFDSKATGEIAAELADGSQQVTRLPECIARGAHHLLFLFRGIWSLYCHSSSGSGSSQLGKLTIEFVAGIMFGASVIFVAFLRPYVQKNTIAVQKSMATAAGFAEERLIGIRTVQAFARSDEEVVGYERHVNKVYRGACKRSFSESLQTVATQSIGYVGIARILMVCGAMCSAGTLTVGSLVAFTARSVLVLLAVRGLLDVSRATDLAAQGSSRLLSLFQSSTTNNKNSVVIVGNSNHEKKLPFSSLSFNNSIEFKNVSFAYPARPEILVWKNVSFSIGVGCKLAVVGHSGSGKSTLGMLLLKLYSSQHGRIEIDGIDLALLDTNCLRHQIGYVAQESVLFDGTVAENIAFGIPSSQHKLNKRGIDEQELDLEEDEVLSKVEAAAKKAMAHQFIIDLPEGYATNVGPRGVALSGGQRQRIAIARALVKNPRILVLDEATNALDEANEAQVRQAISSLMSSADGMTLIVIGHRLADATTADEILVFSGGKIVEKGTFQELSSKKDGHFCKVVA